MTAAACLFGFLSCLSPQQVASAPIIIGSHYNSGIEVNERMLYGIGPGLTPPAPALPPPRSRVLPPRSRVLPPRSRVLYEDLAPLPPGKNLDKVTAAQPDTAPDTPLNATPDTGPDTANRPVVVNQKPTVFSLSAKGGPRMPSPESFNPRGFVAAPGLGLEDATPPAPPKILADPTTTPKPQDTGGPDAPVQTTAPPPPDIMTSTEASTGAATGTDGTEASPVPRESATPTQNANKERESENYVVAALPTQNNFSILFDAGSADIGGPATETIEALSKRLKNEPSTRLSIMSFASADRDNPSQARRLSLSRAIALRDSLIEKGIDSLRIDVKALGSVGEASGAPDRADIVVLSP